MNFVPAIRFALRVLRREPDGVLPLYLAGAAVPLVGQTILLAGVAVAFFVLAAGGRIADFVDAIAELDLEGLDPVEPDPETLAALVDALSILVTPTTLAVLGVAVLGTLVAAVVAGGVVGAAQIHAVRAALDGDPALPAGVAGPGRDAWRFVWLTVLAVVLYALPVVLAAGLVGLAAAASPVLAVLAVLLAVALVLPALLAVHVSLLFTPQAVVVDDVGALAAVRHNLRFVRSNPWTAAGFIGLELAASLAIGSLGGVLALLSLPSVVPLLSLFVVAPVLGLVGTAIYLDPVPNDNDPTPSDSDPAVTDHDPAATDHGPAASEATPDADRVGRPSTGARLRAAGRRASRELAGFLRREVGLVGVSLVIFLLGSAVGWRATSTLALPPQTAPAPGEVFGLVPIDDALNLAANNWRVAIAQVFAGAAAGIPTLVNLAFNGVVVGGLAGAGFDPVVFLALVVPHGIIEVPAIAAASALGLSLARDVWRYARGRTGADALATSVERAFYVLLGLVPVFLLAGFIEAFLTPWVGSFVAGG